MSSILPLAVALLLISGFQTVMSMPCNQEHLLNCARSLRVLSDNQDLNFAATKKDLDTICPDLNKGLRCIDEYTRRCMAPVQRSHFNKLYAGSSMVIQDICQEGPYQDEFLKHANCMWEVKQDYEECARDYQQKIQDMSNLMSNESSDSDTEHNVRRLCCSFQEYLRCSHAIVMDTCGAETAQFTKRFLDRMASSLIQVHCEKYPPGSQICQEDINSARLSSQVSAVLVGGSLLLIMFQHWT